MAKQKSPFVDPGKNNKAVDTYVEQQIEQGVNDSNAAVENAKDEGRGYYNEQLKTPGKALYNEQNNNIAKFGGSKGHINNRSYAKTLKLAREADAYNNKPQDEMFSVGTMHTGGIKNLGTGYQRPRIQTMETRAMDQAFQLDTSRKQAMQALQAAVDHKDLDAFIRMYQYLYDRSISKEQANILMRQFERQRLASQMLTKDVTQWHAEFDRYLGTDTVTKIYNLAIDDPAFGNALSAKFMGYRTPDLEQLGEQAFIKNYVMQKLNAKSWDQAVNSPGFNMAYADGQNQYYSTMKPALNELMKIAERY